MGTMDLSEKKLSEDKSENKKCCTDCKTTKTPLWRGGPAGPKSLCNACGIRRRKNRRSAVGLNGGTEKKRGRSRNSTSTSALATNTTDTVSAKGNLLSESFKMSLMTLGNEFLLERSSSPIVVKKQRCQRRRKLGEVEQAAVSLMALACGFVFA